MNRILKTLGICLLMAVTAAQADAKSNKIAIAAHRGFWKCEAAGQAQNSIASLKAAQENGFWGSEFDVHFTSDNKIVVNHDPAVNGVSIHDNTYATLKEQKLKNGENISTLDEYLAQGLKSKKTVLVLEVKDQGSDERSVELADSAIARLKAYGLFKPSRVIFISFNYAACKHLASLAPKFMVQYLEADKTPAECHADNIKGIDYTYKAFYQHPEWVAEAHKLGMEVNAWTVNKKADIQKMIDLGVDCITTNEPLLVREMLGKRENRK